MTLISQRFTGVIEANPETSLGERTERRKCFDMGCYCRPEDRARAKYELVTSLRTHLGCQDDAFGCMGVAEDAEGRQGVFLRKNVIEVAGRALRHNITALAPRILPFSELVYLCYMRCAFQ